MVEPFGNSVQVPYTPCSHCEDEVREGSVQSNHSELTSKTSTHLSFSAVHPTVQDALHSPPDEQQLFQAVGKVSQNKVVLRRFPVPSHLYQVFT